MLHHLLSDVGDIGVDVAPHEIAVGDIPRRGLPGAAMGSQGTYNVALGYHAPDVVAVAYDEDADVSGRERRRHRPQVRSGVNAQHCVGG